MNDNRNPEQKLSRRRVLQAGAAAAGGLVVSIVLPLPRARAATGVPQPMLTAWLRVAPDDTVTVMIPSAEMGQGITTSLPMLIAEELEVDWRKIKFEAAPADPAYANPIFHMQATGGSTSIRAFYTLCVKLALPPASCCAKRARRNGMCRLPSAVPPTAASAILVAKARVTAPLPMLPPSFRYRRM